MAADSGGNCALSEPGQGVVAHGVTIIGTSNLPGTVAQSCSTLYANNLVTFLAELVDDEGQVNLDMENEVIAGPLACHQGEVTHSRILEILS
jgi:NAD(P) transhydrogenase subunit alpha